MDLIRSLVVQGQVRLFLSVAVHDLVDEQAGLGYVVGEDKEKLASIKSLVQRV